MPRIHSAEADTGRGKERCALRLELVAAGVRIQCHWVGDGQVQAVHHCAMTAVEAVGLVGHRAVSMYQPRQAVAAHIVESALQVGGTAVAAP